ALDAFVDEYDAFAASIEEVDLSGFADLSEMADLDPTDPEAMAKLEELQQKSEDLQQQAEDLQADLQSQTEALSDASSKLADLCDSK
ncbi:MAG: hypothetical protein QM606_04695, partial [Leucobacter sp.]